MDGFKDSTRMKYMTGGPVKKAMGGTFNERGKRATLAEMEAEDRRMAGRPVEGVSSRPTDSSGRRATDADLGMARSTKKPMPKGLGAITDRELQMLAKPMLKKKSPNLGAVTDREMQMLKKAVPAYSDKPMIRRNKGGLMAMPKGKGKC
jgi:hypothetical protein